MVAFFSDGGFMEDIKKKIEERNLWILLSKCTKYFQSMK